MKNPKIYFAFVIALLMSGLSFAQNKWSAEFRPGINFATEDFGSSHIETGFGFELTVAYRFIEHLDGYVGWGYNNFSLENSEVDFDETGYTFGLQFIHPIGSSESLSYLLRVGGVYNHLEVEDTDGDLIDDSGHGLGWQIGAGLDYNLGNNWNLRPTLRYRSLSRDLDVENTMINVDLNYVSFGLGISKSF